jgi:hypothetical protein
MTQLNFSQIVEDLDKHATEFNFPMFDNANLEYAAARLSAFQSGTEWLITFEVLAFSTREVEFVNDIYAFGPCTERQGLFCEEIPLSSVPSDPIFDPETNEFIADWQRWSVKIGEDVVSFSPTVEEYARSGIVVDGTSSKTNFSEIGLFRFLLDFLGTDRFFLSDSKLLGHFPKCKGLGKFVQTTQWEHPDIGNQEKPSRNISIRSLVDALCRRNAALFETGLSNTHWSYWSGSI